MMVGKIVEKVRRQLQWDEDVDIPLEGSDQFIEKMQRIDRQKINSRIFIRADRLKLGFAMSKDTLS